MKPVPREEKPTQGWVVDYNFLSALVEHKVVAKEVVSMEEAEAVILALADLGHLELSK